MMKNRLFSGKRLLGVLLATTLIFQSATVSYATESETVPEIEVTDVDSVEAADSTDIPENNENEVIEIPEETEIPKADSFVEVQTEDFAIDSLEGDVIIDDNDDLNNDLEVIAPMAASELSDVTLTFKKSGAGTEWCVGDIIRLTVSLNPSDYSAKNPVELSFDDPSMVRASKMGSNGLNYNLTLLKAGIVTATVNVDGVTASEAMHIEHKANDFVFEISESGFYAFSWNAGKGIDKYEFYNNNNLVGEFYPSGEENCFIEIDPELCKKTSTSASFSVVYYYQDGISKSVSKSVRFTRYTITYNCGVGTNSESNPSYYYSGDSRTLADAIAPEGYAFNGWYTDPEFKSNRLTSLRNCSGNLVLYAKFSLNNYSVTFNSKGGSSVAKSYYAFGGSIAEPSVVPTKADCIFGGWFKDSACTEGNEYDFSKTVAENIGENKDFTLYAMWSAEPKEITIRGFKEQLLVGKKFSITVGITPSDAPQEFILDYVASPSGCAKVSRDGMKVSISGKKEGIITLNFSTENGLSQSRTVYIQDPSSEIAPTSIEFTGIDNNELIISRDDKYQITAKVLPENATNKKLIWTSSNDAVVTVDQTGMLYGASVGSAIITARAELGGISRSINVTVEEKLTGLTLKTTGIGYGFKTNGEVNLELVTTPNDYEPKSPAVITVDSDLLAFSPVDDSGKVFTTGIIENAGIYNVTVNVDGVTVKKKIIIKHRSKDFTYTYDKNGDITFYWNSGKEMNEYKFYDDDDMSFLGSVTPSAPGADTYVTPFPGKPSGKYNVTIIYTYKDGSKTVSDQFTKTLDFRKQFKIKYHLGKGTNSDRNPKYYWKGYDLDPLYDALPPEGFAFEGWYTEKSYTNRISDLSEFTGNLDIYANYKQLPSIRIVNLPESIKVGEKVTYQVKIDPTKYYEQFCTVTYRAYPEGCAKVYVSAKGTYNSITAKKEGKVVLTFTSKDGVTETRIVEFKK